MAPRMQRSSDSLDQHASSRCANLMVRGVVESDASGVGGCGHMLIQLSGLERPTLLQFMCVAEPRGVTR